MILAGMQPYFMPYLGYWQLINAVDKFIVYGYLNFIQRGWINRNRILQNTGEMLYITIPIKNKYSSSLLISEAQICNSQDWSYKMLRTLSFNYKKAPFYDEIYPLIEKLLSKRYEALMSIIVESICNIADFLDIDTIIDYDNERFLDLEEKLTRIENDYSVLPDLEMKKPEKKMARIIEICRMENSQHLINAIGGMGLYDKKEFEQYGIKLEFIKMNDISYPQFNHDFVPNLSIIDVLMHNGKEGTKKLLNEYTLV